ncbi:methyltransferase [Nocardioides sp. TF02-7]|uniref:methyltransferase n=1 Tax=Nocardioides sp. TF02-7 TaxID=2917724 RepID=UPI001F053B9C|nr:methyltransferase [Nocardioides sp. TF02-7]UMG91154.1 methyltransferase domain-containing protein [Nocardioides sp. TF02-7]
MAAAKAAIADKNWTEARRLLAPLVAENPRGAAAVLLARSELELGRPEVAAPLVAAFKAWRPRHVGARVLGARIHLASGSFDEAESEARAALELEPDHPAVPRLLERIAAGRAAAESERLVRLVDAQHVRARREGPTRELLAAARTLQRMRPGPDWTRDRLQATIAYFHHASDLRAALRNYDPHLIDISTRFDYIAWPRRIQQYVRGRSVLDVGCGFGGYGMGFLIAGTKSYTGLDPAMELDSSRAKNKRVRKWEDMGVTPRQIAEALPAIRLLQSSSEDTTFEETFDTIALHNVTEHLMSLDEVLRGLTRLCRRDSVVVFHHHNYYCWNGHHLAPNQPAQLDESDPRHQQVYDWRHIDLVPDLPEDHYIRTNLNRVRLDELREVTERYYEIERWDEVPSSPETLERLTPQVLDRVRGTVPDITERELSVNAVLAVARPKR